MIMSHCFRTQGEKQRKKKRKKNPELIKPKLENLPWLQYAEKRGKTSAALCHAVYGHTVLYRRSSSIHRYIAEVCNLSSHVVGRLLHNVCMHAC